VPSVPLRVLTAVVLVTACACTGTASTKGSGAVVARGADGRPICPLTGQPFAQGVDPDRPTVAVKIENSPEARPQGGLGAADIVYEEPVEGGLSWLVALFQCGEPDLAGPVRNAHPADAAILAAHTPAVFAHAGATGAAAGALQAVTSVQQADGAVGGDAFQRLADRPVPHNLFVSVPKLRALAKQRRAPQPWVSFEAPAPAASEAEPQDPGGAATVRPRSAPSVQFTQGPSSVRWTWDVATSRYVRQLVSGPLTDTSTKPVGVANVVFLWVTVTDSDTRDAFGSAIPILTLTGQGDALVLRNGVEQSGRWVRKSPSDPPSLVDRKGHPMALTAGHTWIHLVATDTPVFVR
jgi:DUF3048 family protein